MIVMVIILHLLYVSITITRPQVPDKNPMAKTRSRTSVERHIRITRSKRGTRSAHGDSRSGYHEQEASIGWYVCDARAGMHRTSLT